MSSTLAQMVMSLLPLAQFETQPSFWEAYGSVVLIWSLAFGFLCGIIAASRDRNPVGWLLAGALFGVFALIVLVVSPQGDASRQGKKICPQCAEWIPEPARKCSLCGREFAERTVNRPPGIPPWPGFGRLTPRALQCSKCGRAARFNDQGACTSCESVSPLLRHHWGYEEMGAEGYAADMSG